MAKELSKEKDKETWTNFAAFVTQHHTPLESILRSGCESSEPPCLCFVTAIPSKGDVMPLRLFARVSESGSQQAESSALTTDTMVRLLMFALTGHLNVGTKLHSCVLDEICWTLKR